MPAALLPMNMIAAKGQNHHCSHDPKNHGEATATAIVHIIASFASMQYCYLFLSDVFLTCSATQGYVRRMPSSKETLDFQPVE